MRLVAAEILKLRRRRGLMIWSLLLALGPTIVAYVVLLALHAANPDKHGPAGTIDNLQNPRFELEEHYYNPVHTKLPSLGLEPTLLSENLIESTLGVIQRYRDRVISDVIAPRTQWRPAPPVGQPAS